MGGRFAMLIGNSQYDDDMLASLTTPDADVATFAEVLADPEIGAFDDVQTMVNKSSSQVTRGIARFFSKRRRNDLLLLYFSGHGVVDEHGRLYLGVRDTEHDLLRGTAIPATMITDEMDHSRSRVQTLILDCCHSGAFDRGAKGALGLSIGTANKFEGKGVGRVVLTATDSTQYAWEGDNVVGSAETSVFTKHLIEGLQTGSADINGNGVITVDDLYDYVHEKVITETPKQTPGKWTYKQQGDIEIARNPFAGTVAKPLPEAIDVALASPLVHVREGGVRELGALLKSPDKGLIAGAHAALTRMARDDSRKVSGLAESLLSENGGAPAQPEVTPESQEAPKLETTPTPKPAEVAAPLQHRKVRTDPEPKKPSAPPITDRTSRRVPPPTAENPEPHTQPIVVPRSQSALAESIGAVCLLLLGWLGYSFHFYDAAIRDLRFILGLGVAAALAGFLFGGPPSLKRASIVVGAMIGAVLVANMASFMYADPTALISQVRGSGAAIGGLMTGIAIRAILPAIGVREIAIITGGWLLGGIIFAILWYQFGIGGAEIVIGVIGGIAIALGLQGHIRNWSWKTVLEFAAIWGLVMAFRDSVTMALLPFFGGSLMSVTLASATVITTAGGMYTVWRVRRGIAT